MSCDYVGKIIGLGNFRESCIAPISSGGFCGGQGSFGISFAEVELGFLGLGKGSYMVC